MNYIYKDERVVLKLKEYLNKKNISYLDKKIGDLYLINVFNDELKTEIEKEEKLFLDGLDMDLSYGYMVTKKYKDETIVKVRDIEIGGQSPILISGPCSVESYESLRRITSGLIENKVDILRAGAFKPRTSPYEFQGLGIEGLKILKEVSKEFNIPIVSELVDIRHIDKFIELGVDMIQVGARNINNYEMLKEVGKLKIPVLLKRGFSTTIKEYLQCAEYILSNGNDNVVLCERGIRTFEDSTRNTMDISAIANLKRLSHLPVLGDASHGTGVRELVEPLSLAAIASGADGIVIESHISPNASYSDSAQTIEVNKLKDIKEKSLKIKKIISL